MPTNIFLCIIHAHLFYSPYVRPSVYVSELIHPLVQESRENYFVALRRIPEHDQVGDSP
jgi:hypothetical protein